MIHGAVDPYVVASAPISGGGGLGDVAVHSSLVPTPVLEQVFSPLVIAVPATSARPGLRLPTACTGNQMSLRLEVNNLLDSSELEIACLDPKELGPNMTVLVINLRNKVTRCARTDAQGLLRIPVPANVGDPIYIQVFNEADAVDSYKTCTLKPGAPAGRLIDTWEQAASTFTPVANGATCPSGDRMPAVSRDVLSGRLAARRAAGGARLLAPDPGHAAPLHAHAGGARPCRPDQLCRVLHVQDDRGHRWRGAPPSGDPGLEHGGRSLRPDRHRERLRARGRRPPVPPAGRRANDARVRRLRYPRRALSGVRQPHAERSPPPEPRHPRHRAPRADARRSRTAG